MKTYVILRRGGWRSGEELEKAAGALARSRRQRDVRRHPLDPQLRAGRGFRQLGTVCIYQASSPEAIRDHAERADLPVNEIVEVADTVIARADPEPAPTA